MINQNYVFTRVIRVKRLVDIIVAVFLLATLWPLLLLISLLIKVTSRGPIIYCQRRVGITWCDRTEFFDIYKFRTMCDKAELGTGAIWAVENDPRLTFLGRALRKSRLDELPQLFNVLKGDMSLVGPRPERPEIVVKLDRLIPYYSERTYGVLPGITGLAQIYQGYDTSVEDVKSKILYDFAYSLSLTKLNSWLVADFFIICRTLLIMLLGSGR
jgi:lipopolysaccharide/colanic/teichoic acid biosynthesis glycosyltransferase